MLLTCCCRVVIIERSCSSLVGSCWQEMDVIEDFSCCCCCYCLDISSYGGGSGKGNRDGDNDVYSDELSFSRATI